MIRIIRPCLVMHGRLHCGLTSIPERQITSSLSHVVLHTTGADKIIRVPSPYRERSLSPKQRSSYTKSPPLREQCNGHLYALLGLLGLFGSNASQQDKDQQQEKSSKKKQMSQLDKLIARAILKMDSQEYEQANELLHQALALAQSERDIENELIVLNLLAEDYVESGDLERAEATYVDIIRRMISERSVNPTDSAILELSLRLAAIYSRLPGNNSKAINGYSFVIDNLTERLKEFIDKLDALKVKELTKEVRNDLALLGWTYDWKAKHHISRNEFTEAANLLKEALDISLVVLGRTHQQTLILYNDLGTALAMDNRPDEGCKYIRKAVDGATEVNSYEVASFCANLGLIYLQMMQLSEASQYCQRSYELANSNKNHYSSANVIELSKNCLNEIKKIVEHR